MRQVLTETDAMRAIYDYMAEQIDGRFRLEFPEEEEVIDILVASLRDPMTRMLDSHMYMALVTTIGDYGAALSSCMLNGCTNDKQHRFLREFINLAWDARRLTTEWLKGQGIVPGQSAN